MEESIKLAEEKIEFYKQSLQDMRKQLKALDQQEKEREKYVSSKEIVDLIFKHTGKKVNMSTIKRWADEGYLGEVVEEREKFWALHTKQGKKRFLYPKVLSYQFLHEKGYLKPDYEVLDRVEVTKPGASPLIGIIIDSSLNQDAFEYTLQIEGSFDIVTNVHEKWMKKTDQEVDEE